jgi:hypothetical protein
METIFSFNEDDENVNKINLDELYEINQKKNLQEIALYNKILNRVHTRIKTTSRQRNNNQCCWYIIPEILLGASNYNNSTCITYIIQKLKENGFDTIYTHPNLLFISWANWTPSYVRNEFKKQTGISIDGKGNKKNENNSNNNTKISSDEQNNNLILNLKKTNNLDDKKSVKFNDIKNYNPSGKLIYNSELFKKINDKIN